MCVEYIHGFDPSIHQPSPLFFSHPRNTPSFPFLTSYLRIPSCGRLKWAELCSGPVLHAHTPLGVASDEVGFKLSRKSCCLAPRGDPTCNNAQIRYVHTRTEYGVLQGTFPIHRRLPHLKTTGSLFGWFTPWSDGQCSSRNTRANSVHTLVYCRARPETSPQQPMPRDEGAFGSGNRNGLSRFDFDAI